MRQDALVVVGRRVSTGVSSAPLKKQGKGVEERTTSGKRRIVYLSCSVAILVPAQMTDSSISATEKLPVRDRQERCRDSMGRKSDGRSCSDPTHNLGPQGVGSAAGRLKHKLG
jgi:hypothetical protein